VSGYGPPSGQPSVPYEPPSVPYEAPSVPYGAPPSPGQGPPTGPPSGLRRPGSYRSSTEHEPPPEEPPGPASDSWSRPDEW
jgi:hypothetical protein